VIVDLTSCEFIDSAIAEVLIAAHLGRGPGERFELVMPSGDGFVNRVLKLMRVRKIILTHESLADALRSVGESSPFGQSVG
jgi:anti-anti-sigma regulatory factor